MNTKAVAIIAPGLIGGSLALALGDQKGEWEVRIWTRDSTSLQEVKERFFPAKVSTEFKDLIPGAKIIILCTPISVMGELARQMAPFVDKDAVVTDVGSVKVAVACELKPIFGDRFVGAHPMAGSERSGMQAARRDLFLNATCILTPFKDSAGGATTEFLQAVRDLWASVGAHTVEMTPEAHDIAVANVSHLPHAAAVALVRAVCSKDSSLQKFAGKGYRDTTRIAQGLPDLWVDIFLENREPLLQSLTLYMDQLQTLTRLLRTIDKRGLRAFLEEAKAARAIANELPTHNCQLTTSHAGA